MAGMSEVPAAIEPDDKNWTWVLERPCPECGFVAADHPRESIGSDLRGLKTGYDAALADPRARTRPDPHVWSALEYGCHVRDVYRLYRDRLGLMLDEHAPEFANWDQDETAVSERYDLQDPDLVAADLAAAGDELAAAFDAVDGDGWARTGTRSDGVVFTVETFAVYFLHDPIHHLWDIEQGYGALGEYVRPA